MLRSNIMTRNFVAPACVVGASILGFFFVHSDFYQEIRFYDEGVYVVLAKALASGLGYVHESLPGSPLEGKYPPFWPLFLGGIWLAFPNFPANLVIMRVSVLLSGCLFLLVSFYYLKNSLRSSFIQALGVIAMIALHPLFLDFASLLVSEIPFALVSMTSLYFYSRFGSSHKIRNIYLALGLASIAVFTRIIGFSLFAAFIIHLLIQGRRKLSGSIVFYAASLFYLWQSWSWHTREAYMTYPKEIAINYIGYFDYLDIADWTSQLFTMVQVNAVTLLRYWTLLIFPWAQQFIIMPVILTIGVYFYGRDRMHRLGPQDYYSIISLLLILLWPWPINDRFLLVISPLLIYFFFQGVQGLLLNTLGQSFSKTTTQRLVTIVVSLVIFVSVAFNLLTIEDRRQQKQSLIPVYEEFQQTLSWIRDNTPVDAILIGDSDPAYYLFTDRKAIRLSYPDPFLLYYSEAKTADLDPYRARQLAMWFKTKNACYLIRESVILGPWGRHHAKLIGAILTDPASNFSPVYVSPHQWFAVFKAEDCPKL